MKSKLRMLTLAGSMAILGAGVLAVLTPESASAYDRRGGSNDSIAEVRLQTSLTGGALNAVKPHGSAKFRARQGQSSFNVEVEDVKLPDGTVLTVTLQGATGGTTVAGTLTLKLQTGELELDSRDGDTVPQAKAGDTVIVSDATAGAIASGVLR